MFLTQYFSETDQHVMISREQASTFAKEVAGDFNPIHDIDAKRFCVPGDLLFSVLLAKTGVSRSMSVKFNGMVTDETKLSIPCCDATESALTDENQKNLVDVERQGEVSTNPEFIESLIRSYVDFSGHCFPHVFVKLMKKNGVMINPSRPMVMYERMSISFDTLDITTVSLSCRSAELTVDGKRGNAAFEFDFISDGKVVGHGTKHMLLSGLKPFDDSEMSNLVSYYNNLKESYTVAA